MKEKAYEVARNPKYDRYGWALASMVYKCFDKKTVSRVNINEKLAEERHKPVIEKLKRKRTFATFKDNIWAEDLFELSSKYKNVRYLLCLIDVFTKYAWVKPFQDKKAKTALNGFFNIKNESNRKPNKLGVHHRREFHKTYARVVRR